VKLDYQDGKIEADDWTEQRPRLIAERDAAQAEVERSRRQETDLLSIGDLDAESETLLRLAAIRAAVAGEVQEAEGIEGVRSALIRLFDRFILHPGIPGQTHVELIGKRWIEPV